LFLFFNKKNQKKYGISSSFFFFLIPGVPFSFPDFYISLTKVFYK
jgi:hypothetical protein